MLRSVMEFYSLPYPSGFLRRKCLIKGGGIMGSLKELKKLYENVAIPEELAVRVQQEIAKSRNKQMEKAVW